VSRSEDRVNDDSWSRTQAALSGSRDQTPVPRFCEQQSGRVTASVLSGARPPSAQRGYTDHVATGAYRDMTSRSGPGGPLSSQARS
jgi:hypothetical protein